MASFHSVNIPDLELGKGKTCHLINHCSFTRHPIGVVTSLPVG